MDVDEGLWGGLPFELIERVLSFVPVLDLCRLRSVCKRWNELICKATFHDLCEQSRKENAHLFVTRHFDYGDWSMIDPKFNGQTSFFDLDSRRWYSLKPLARRWERRCHLLSADDGLVCDYDGATTWLAICDPIARTRTEIPEAPVFLLPDEPPPIVVTAVDPVTRSFRIFVITNNDEQDRRIFMYESSTSEWRGLENPPEHRGIGAAVSAVCFGGMLYVIFRLFPGGRFVLLSYNLQEDAWKIFNLRIPKKKRPPQLVVSCNRLFMMMWVSEPLQCPVTPAQQAQRKFHLLFEVREVLVAEPSSKIVAECSSRMVAQFTRTQLQQMFGEEDVAFDIAYAVPCFNFRGFCKSLVLMSFLSGKLISYDLASGLAVGLPAGPAYPADLPESEEDYEHILPLTYYQGKYTNLSLRSLSSPLLDKFRLAGEMKAL